MIQYNLTATLQPMNFISILDKSHSIGELKVKITRPPKEDDLEAKLMAASSSSQPECIIFDRNVGQLMNKGKAKKAVELLESRDLTVKQTQRLAMAYMQWADQLHYASWAEKAAASIKGKNTNSLYDAAAKLLMSAGKNSDLVAAMRIGEHYLARGIYEKAEYWLRTVVERTDSPSASCRLAAVYLARGRRSDLDRCVELCEKTLPTIEQKIAGYEQEILKLDLRLCECRDYSESQRKQELSAAKRELKPYKSLATQLYAIKEKAMERKNN